MTLVGLVDSRADGRATWPRPRVSGDWAITLTIDTPDPAVPSTSGSSRATRSLAGMCSRRAATSTPRLQGQPRVGCRAFVRGVDRARVRLLRCHVEAPVTVSCSIDGKDTPVDYTATVDFTWRSPTRWRSADGWTATALAYARTADIEPGPDAAAKGCPSRGSQTESGSGTAASPAPVTTAQSPATTGASSDDRFLSRLPISSRRRCRSR